MFKKNGKIKYILELENGPILPTSFELVSFVLFFSDNIFLYFKLFQFVKNSVGATSTNRVKIQVTGRNQCNGMNEALKKEKLSDFMALNFNELEWDGSRFEYC